jgi:putative heme uptake system protein
MPRLVTPSGALDTSAERLVKAARGATSVANGGTVEEAASPESKEDSVKDGLPIDGAEAVSNLNRGEPRLLLLVWDAPNVDMSLGSILGRKPSTRERPDLQAIGSWLVERAWSRQAVDGQEWEAEAVLFVNVAPDHLEALRPWVEKARRSGYAVYARPKVGDSDIDDNIKAYVQDACQTGRLGELFIASGDRKAFQKMAMDLTAEGMAVSYLGFRELAGAQRAIPLVDFDEVPGALPADLCRMSLDILPLEGALLAPLGPLGGGATHLPGVPPAPARPRTPPITTDSEPEGSSATDPGKETAPPGLDGAGDEHAVKGGSFGRAAGTARSKSTRPKPENRRR